MNTLERVAARFSPVLAGAGLLSAVLFALTVGSESAGAASIARMCAVLGLVAFLGAAVTGFVAARSSALPGRARLVAGVSGAVSGVVALIGCGLLAYVTWAMNTVLDVLGL